MVVHPVSHGVSRVPWYSGSSLTASPFGYGALTLYDRPSHAVLLNSAVKWLSSTPENKSSGLASSAFARHYWRNLCWCLFLVLLRCFSSDGSPRTPIWFNARYMDIVHVGFPIRKSPDQWIFAPPRSLSQLVTSFIGSWCQGIPLALFIAWPFELILFRDLVLSWIMQAIFWDFFD